MHDRQHMYQICKIGQLYLSSKTHEYSGICFVWNSAFFYLLNSYFCASFCCFTKPPFCWRWCENAAFADTHSFKFCKCAFANVTFLCYVYIFDYNALLTTGTLFLRLSQQYTPDIYKTFKKVWDESPTMKMAFKFWFCSHTLECYIFACMGRSISWWPIITSQWKWRTHYR